MIRDALERPFPPEVIRSRPGAFGEALLYVEAVEYIRRLNEAFESKWDWTVEGYEIRDREIVVHGSLRAGGVSKHAFGGAPVTISKSGEVVSLADNLKAAATDALKKACSLFGVGLDLYASEARPKNDRGPSTDPRARGDVSPTRTSSPNPPAPTRSRLTAKQLRALYAIAHSRGMSDGALKARAVDQFGVAPDFLSRADASRLIDDLDAS